MHEVVSRHGDRSFCPYRLSIHTLRTASSSIFPKNKLETAQQLANSQKVFHLSLLLRNCFSSTFSRHNGTIKWRLKTTSELLYCASQLTRIKSVYYSFDQSQETLYRLTNQIHFYSSTAIVLSYASDLLMWPSLKNCFDTFFIVFFNGYLSHC